MIIYEVFAWTACMDIGDRSVRESKGLFMSEQRAKAEVESIKSRKHWLMDYSSVDYTAVEVVE